ncbi:hypothetical protein CY34DRAFT_662322 [Suillus luteus UH-Slu-Lm8-n1]|uniref:Uncharacterized protein n=1 Tax=Suillus luteus UH-Slu-Lm8-n1 TaxID=930992 RepID=A0A0D0A7D0_9AGAM|nr:hypothetical protein CY34DRAFT_662322 [Suillus luteus UH-Slu-Lm8-n1]
MTERNEVENESVGHRRTKDEIDHKEYSLPPKIIAQHSNQCIRISCSFLGPHSWLWNLL